VIRGGRCTPSTRLYRRVRDWGCPESVRRSVVRRRGLPPFSNRGEIKTFVHHRFTPLSTKETEAAGVAATPRRRRLDRRDRDRGAELGSTRRMDVCSETGFESGGGSQGGRNGNAGSEPSGARVAAEVAPRPGADGCGALGCCSDRDLLVVHCGGAQRVLCRAHAVRWVRREAETDRAREIVEEVGCA
jgi:hypothetical protein